MPITPFHFGPGAALTALAPRRTSFLAFCATNVAIDVESGINLALHRWPVHAFCHSVVGASLVAAAVVAGFFALRALDARWRLPNPLDWRGLTKSAVAGGAVLGAWTHVLLDSVMHRDIRPLGPWTEANPLLGVVPLGALHLACVGLGVAGAAGVLWRKRQARADSPQDMR